MVLLTADACGFFFFIFIVVVIINVISSIYKSAQKIGGAQDASNLSQALNELKETQANKKNSMTYNNPYTYPQQEVKRPPINWNMIRLNMNKEQINECFDMQALAKGVKKDELYKYVNIKKLRLMFTDVQLRDMVDLDFFEQKLKDIAITAAAGTATYGAVKSVIDKLPTQDAGGVPYTSLKKRAVDGIKSTVNENIQEIKETAKKDIRQVAPAIADKYKQAKSTISNTVRDVTQALEYDKQGLNDAYQGVQELETESSWNIKETQKKLDMEVEAARKEAERVKREALKEADRLKAAALQDANRLKQTTQEDTNKFLQKAASMAVSGAAVKAVADITGKAGRAAEKAVPYVSAAASLTATMPKTEQQPVRQESAGFKPLPIPGMMGSVKQNLEAIHSAISWKEITSEPAFIKPYEKYLLLIGEFSEDD